MGNWFTRHREFSESEISATVIAFRRYMKSKGIKWNDADKTANANAAVLVKGFMLGHDNPDKNPGNVNEGRVCNSLIQLTHWLNRINTTTLTPEDVAAYYMNAHQDDQILFPLQPESTNPAIFVWDRINSDFSRTKPKRAKTGKKETITKCASCGGAVSFDGYCAYCGTPVSPLESLRAAVEATDGPFQKPLHFQGKQGHSSISAGVFRILMITPLVILLFAGLLWLLVSGHETWAFIGGGVIILFIIIALLNKCPNCGSFFTGAVIKRQLLDSRTGYAMKDRAIKDVSGQRIGSYEERVRMQYDTWENRHRCTNCGHEWDEVHKTNRET